MNNDKLLSIALCLYMVMMVTIALMIANDRLADTSAEDAYMQELMLCDAGSKERDVTFCKQKGFE